MGNFSRNTFKLTNILHKLLTGENVDNAKHYVGVRLQQGVPLVDADWNEMEDIRKAELEMILAKAIGNGVPSGSNGFQVRSSGTDNNFIIEAGLLFVDGWLIYNSKSVDYKEQPHRNCPGIIPELPNIIENAPVAQRELIYLDAWNVEIDSTGDNNIMDERIGIETSVRSERVWVVRMVPVDKTADPLDLETIPNRQLLHRYYPLAAINRPVGGQITDGMITDLRRTHLTLANLTHAPLQIYDPVRDQSLDAQRLAAVFSDYLEALDDVFRETPDAFIFPSEVVVTWDVMVSYQDLRTFAVAIREMALKDLLYRKAAMDAMTRFFDIQKPFIEKLQRLLLPPPDGINAGESLAEFLNNYNKYLLSGPNSLATAIGNLDLLGSVIAQERINHEVSQVGGSRLDGTVSLSLISQTPSGPVIAETKYSVTIRLTSLLISVAGTEEVKIVSDAGDDWTVSFESIDSNSSDLITAIPNQTTQDIILYIQANNNATSTKLKLKAFPVRRPLRVFRLPDLSLSIGSEIVAGANAIAALKYIGPSLDPGNIATVSRALINSPGLELPFRIENLSEEQQTFKLNIVPEGTPTGWDDTPTNVPIIPISVGGTRDKLVKFKTSDKDGSTFPQAFTLQLIWVKNDGSETALLYTNFIITFNLI